jgi:hypothetical protein
MTGGDVLPSHKSCEDAPDLPENLIAASVLCLLLFTILEHHTE